MKMKKRKTYAQTVRKLELEGLTTSDAQAIADMNFRKKDKTRKGLFG